MTEPTSDRDIARDQVILEVARAKREFLRGPGVPPGVTMRSSFFTDVWPLVYGVFCDRLRLVSGDRFTRNAMGLSRDGDGRGAPFMGVDPRPDPALDAVRAIVKGYGDAAAREMGELRGAIQTIQRERGEYAVGVARELGQMLSRIDTLERHVTALMDLNTPRGVAFDAYARRRRKARATAKKARAKARNR